MPQPRMNTLKPLSLLLAIALLLFCDTGSNACSMYKLTRNGKTMVGNNEDSWRLTSRISFEKGTGGAYGVAYVGYSDKSIPDGAVNEYGLAFDGFIVPVRKLKDQSTKKNTVSFSDLKMVMQKCKTVDEVYAMLSQYNLSSFNGAMLLFIDHTGKYLVVEADTMITGNDPSYVLANFCPSQTPDLGSVKLPRYRNGVAFLSNKMDTSILFCTALSDTMQVCRKKMGDGTLYTSIYDLNDGMIYLYFYHNYKNRVTFNIHDELAKGNHAFTMASLFPPNAEYEKLSRYKTPQSSSAVFSFFVFCGALFFFSAIFFPVSFFSGRNRPGTKYSGITILLFFLSIILLYYIIALTFNQSIFYLPAPYKDYTFSLLNIAAYIPFLLLVLIVPLCRLNVRVFKDHSWSRFSTWVFTLNNLTYCILIVLFAYWGLFSVFS